MDKPSQQQLEKRVRELEEALAVQKKRFNQVLDECENRFLTLYEQAPLAYHCLDGDGHVIAANQAWLDLLGYEKAEVIGRHFTIFIHPRWLEQFRNHFPGFQQSQTLAGIEFKLIRKDGDFIDVRLIGKLAPESPDDPPHTHCLVYDITAIKQAEQERCRIEEQMRHIQKLESLGVLAGGIAHDFNNLLMVILGNADLALSELSPVSPARENILAIEKAARRSAELCKQMLAYAGKGRFMVQPVHLSEIVEAMTHMLEVSISKKNVLKYNLAKEIPLVDADVSQLRQIIMNLIINATEAIGDRSGVISISTGAMECDQRYLLGTFVHEHIPDGVYSYLEVADTGCGMDNGVKAKLFDPFFTTKFTGRGLGMSAVLGIVRSHKGAIKIYSESGRGTTVKVLFPASQPGESPSAQDTVEEPTMAGKTILLADDEDSVRSVGQQMLERLGFRVITARDGREAVKIFQERHKEIDCVILDLTMPHMDGEEAFREIRRIRDDVRVILSSGYHEQEVTQRFSGKGLAGFIQKPYTLAPLREVLERACHCPGSGDDPAAGRQR